MTWFDWGIVGVFGFFVYQGFRKGFVQQLFDIIGGVVALIIGFYLYQGFGQRLAEVLQVSLPMANVIGFILIVVCIGGVVGFLGRRWHAKHKNEPIALLDGGLGAVFGGIRAAIVLLIILLILVAMPLDILHTPVEDSSFAQDLLRFAPLFYLVQDTSLPADMPRLIVSPEGLQLRALKENDLEGATCLACGAKVHYKGMVKQGLSVYPQTVCPKCGRTSDGCLTFEGYHKIYGVCPYERLGSMGIVDCKVWPNPEPTTVHGKCPVCGRSL